MTTAVNRRDMLFLNLKPILTVILMNAQAKNIVVKFPDVTREGKAYLCNQSRLSYPSVTLNIVVIELDQMPMAFD